MLTYTCRGCKSIRVLASPPRTRYTDKVDSVPREARMKYFFFHLMSWPHLPADFDATHDSAWIWAPNSLYDPHKGHELYREYIDTLAYAEELGFDGVCVNEHHQNAYGLMPSPNIIAGALTQRTH